MQKIISDAICIFFGFVIGLIIIIPILGDPLFPLKYWPVVLLLLFAGSLICGLLKYHFIDK